MKTPVKKRRSYRSPHRAEQAEQTRLRILQAARKVFMARGYWATTMAQVAAEAGTSVETVYAAFKSKAVLLARSVGAALSRDGKGPIQSAGAAAVRLEPDPVEQLRLFARDISVLLSSVSPIFDVVASARVEPEIGALYERMQAARLENLRVMVGWLGDKGGLRDGLDADAATDTVWALASPELYRALTEVRGWSRERFETWLAETLIATLTPPTGRRRPAARR